MWKPAAEVLSLCGTPKLPCSSTHNCLDHHTVSDDETTTVANEIIAAVKIDHSVEAEFAADSGAVDHVVCPADMPQDAEIEVNQSNHHYSDASGGIIKRHGKATVLLTDQKGRKMLCQTQAADVVKPLHSVSRITGPADVPPEAGMVFTNNVGVVIPPGYADEFLKNVPHITEYKRKGNLYVAKFKMSSFPRQGAPQ